VKYYKKLCFTFLIAPCYPCIAISSPLLLSFFILCILNKKKKKLNKYICIYKEWKFDYYAPLPSLFFASLRFQAARRSRAVSGNFPGASAACYYVLLVYQFLAALTPGAL
jgi:hypothetical protein